ncbi:MAG: glycosyltransferase family 2 protein [Nitrospirota bacterium]
MTDSGQPRISAAIVNWNSGQYLRDCLASILDQKLPPCELVVVDNASTDDSVACGRAALDERSAPGLPPVRWIMNRENTGFSRAANQGIAATGGDWFLLLNPDVILSPDFLAEAWSALRARPTVGLLAGKVLRFDRRTIDTAGQFLRPSRRVRERGYGDLDRGQYDRAGEVFSVCGAVALYRRAMLEDIAVAGEYFDEDFFAFFEDADLGWRAQRGGWRGWYQPTAVAYHARGGTNPTEGARRWARWQMPRRPLEIQFHILVNRYLMLIKNESAGAFLLHLPALAWAELVDWGYVLFVQPRLLAYAPRAASLMLRAFAKRRTR